MSNQAVTMAIRWGQKSPCCHVVRAINFMCVSACAGLHAVLAAPPALPDLSRFNPWCKLLRPTRCHDYGTGISTANPVGNTWDLFSQSIAVWFAWVRQCKRLCRSLDAVKVLYSLNSKCGNWVLSHWAAGNCQGCFQAFHKWRKSQKGWAANFIKLICKFQIQIFWFLSSNLISLLWKAYLSLPVTLRSTSADENQLSILQPPTDICTHIMSHVNCLSKLSYLGTNLSLVYLCSG